MEDGGAARAARAGGPRAMEQETLDARVQAIESALKLRKGAQAEEDRR
jgi:hypothetical protein